jgi:hypothetical protein
MDWRFVGEQPARRCRHSVDVTTCVHVPRDDPRRGRLQTRKKGVDVDTGQFVRLVSCLVCIERMTHYMARTPMGITALEMRTYIASHGSFDSW